MNTNALKKHYDKLGIKERFAAIAAAATRKDDAELDALMSTAPRVSYRMPNTFGISRGFIHAMDWYIMAQYGRAASFYCLANYNHQPAAEDAEITDTLIMIQKDLWVNRKAFEAICKEYGVEPAAMLEGYPFNEVLEMVFITIEFANQLSPLPLDGLEACTNGMRKVIEDYRQQWEG